MSEETEVKKDKQWAIKEAKETINGFFDRSSRGVAQYYEDELIASIADIINQLDEPEVLSQEWIDRHTYYEDEYDFYYADPDELKNLLVPKQEEVTDEEKESETVASIMADFFGAAARLGEVLGMEVKELEE